MHEKTKKQVSIIIPAYNEESRIAQVLDYLLNQVNFGHIEYEVIVVDDGSTDKTVQILEGYDLKIVKHEKNKGYGASLKDGIAQAQYDLIAITDADGTYPVDRIPELIGYMDDYDMAVGARTGKGAQIPLIRKPAKWLLSKYANYLVKENIPDLNSGLRVFKKEIYQKFRNLLPSGFSFTTTITLALLSNDYRVKYIPIKYFKRGGKSKIKPIRDTINFFALVTRTSLYFNPLRVFIPISLALLIVGFILLAYEIFVSRDITDKTMILFLWGMQFGIMALLADMISRRSN